mgnify:CR=1 FL=1
MNVLADVPLARVADEAGHPHVFAQLPDRRRHAHLHRACRIGEPGVAGRIALPLDFSDDVCQELLKFVRAGDEIRLAVHFDERAGGVIGRHTVADEPLFRDAPRLFRRARQTALAENRVRLFDVAVRFGEGVLALHHAGAGLVAQRLDLFCCDCCHRDVLHNKSAGPI